METEDVTLQLLRQITDDFSEERILGRGSFGVVYKGVTETEVVVAVKKINFPSDNPDLGIQQFRNELDKLVMLKHQNIVQIFGYCFEIENKSHDFKGMKIPVEEPHIALCLEYLPNGSLQNHLSDDFCGLDWHTRYKIIKGICDGLKYIHEDQEQPIYHLDLKPANVLLDENMVPKIADFGLSKIFNEELTRTTQSPLGTLGYQPPEYIDRGEISKKFDIFSLGVMMIEIVSGLKGPSIHLDMRNGKFIDFVKTNWRNRFPETWSHSSLELHCLQIEICTQIALTCMEEDSQKRPSIVEIIHELNKTEIGIGKLPEKRGCHETTSGLTMNNKMKNMRKKSRQMTDQNQSFNLMTCSKYNELEFDDVRETSWNVGEQLIIGRKDEKNKLMDSLLKGMMPKIIILPICGIGGIGKTTFAKLIYNDTKFKHYSRVWVHVSPRFDLNKIGNSIISQLSETGSLANERETISSCLTKLLFVKKILIVLDDIWEDNQLQLEDLKAMLNLGDSMNVLVLVTTRSESVARKICTNIEKPYKIKPLTDGMCWEIIRQRSGFDTRDNKEPELEDLGKEIARKCRGVALAAQSLGYMKCDQWSQVKDNDIWKDASLPNHVLASLKLSYSLMDPHLKPCFTYCAIFPKGHKIDKDELIHQWISMGFIEPTILHSTIQLCEKYIEQLKGFSFLQPLVSLTATGLHHDNVTQFTMHDLVHDLARLVLADELVLRVSKVDNINTEGSSKLGNINTMGSSCRYALLDDCSKKLELYTDSPAKIRALRFLDCGEIELHDSAFSCAKNLRVLDLSHCFIQELPNSVGQLKQLRYLNAPKIQHQMIPNSITKLLKLMYLSLHGSSALLKLPDSIGDLKGLIYLDLSGCSGLKELPKSFGKFKKLVHLDLSNCSDVAGDSEFLQSLTNLEYLNLTCCLSTGVLPEHLGGLSKLKYLNLSCSFYETYRSVGGIKEHVIPSRCRKLVKGMPESLDSLTKLQYLNLSQCHCMDDDGTKMTAAMGGLTELQHLYLSGFLDTSQLEKHVSTFIECIGNLSNLEYVDLSHNCCLRSVPDCFGCLGKLRVLDLSYCKNLVWVSKSIVQIGSLQMVLTKGCNFFGMMVKDFWHKANRTNKSVITLPEFKVQADHGASSSNIALLQGVNPNELKITGLEKVKSIEELESIRLVGKERIKELGFEWSREWSRGSMERAVEDNVVLGGLVPPSTIQSLHIRGYNSAMLPGWLMGIPAYNFPNLVRIYLVSLDNCISLPPLGQLPNLEKLYLKAMQSITKIDEDLCGGAVAFPRLRKFTLRDMQSLQVWNTMYSGYMFPRICTLIIKDCPKLRLPCPPNVYDLIIRDSDALLSSWGGSTSSDDGASLSSSLCVTCLRIQGCKVPMHEWRLIHHLPALRDLHIKDCTDLTSSPEITQALAPLKCLSVDRCQVAQLPEWLRHLTSLQTVYLTGLQW